MSSEDGTDQISLAEADVAVDLIKEYRHSTGLGVITIANQIETEAAKVRATTSRPVPGATISKSVLQGWLAAGTLPQSSHLPRLNIFFRSRRFRGVISEVEFLWAPLKGTIDYGRHLLRWHQYDSPADTSEMNGDWTLAAHRPEAREWSAGVNFCVRLRNVPGENFGVAHAYNVHAPLGRFSGYLFKRGVEYRLHLRSRMQRTLELQWTLQKDARLDRQGVNYWQIPNPLFDEPKALPWFMILNSPTPVSEDAKKFFDSILWSVLPHG